MQTASGAEDTHTDFGMSFKGKAVLDRVLSHTLPSGCRLGVLNSD